MLYGYANLCHWLATLAKTSEHVVTISPWKSSKESVCFLPKDTFQRHHIILEHIWLLSFPACWLWLFNGHRSCFFVFDLWPVPDSFIILNIFTLSKPSSCQSIVNVCRWPRKWGLIFENMGFVNENKHSMNWTMSPIFDYAKRTTFICVINETNAMEMEKTARYSGDEKLFLPLIIYSSGGYQLWSLISLSK